MQRPFAPRQVRFYQATCKPMKKRQLFVGGGLSAMQSTRWVRKIASSFIAGKPPPTVRCLLRDSAMLNTGWRLLSNNLQPTEETGFCGSGPGGVPFVREYCISVDEHSSDVMTFSRTSPLPLSLLRDCATSKSWWGLPRVCCATALRRRRGGASHTSRFPSGLHVTHHWRNQLKRPAIASQTLSIFPSFNPARHMRPLRIR